MTFSRCYGPMARILVGMPPSLPPAHPIPTLPPANAEYRTCDKCEEDKLLEDFPVRGIYNEKIRRRLTCIDCEKEAHRQRWPQRA